MFELLVDREKYVAVLQNSLKEYFPQSGYQVWVFGSFLTEDFTQQSDIDISIYCNDISLLLKIKVYIDEYLAKDELAHDIVVFEYNDEHYINIPIVFYGKALTNYELPNIIDFMRRMVTKWTTKPLDILLERSKI